MVFLESPSSYHRRVANVSGAEPGGSIGFKTPRGIRPQNQRFQALPDSPRHPVRRRRWTCHAGVVLPCTTAEPLISCCQKSETRSNHLAIPDKPNSSRVVFEYSISRPGPGYMQAELPPSGSGRYKLPASAGRSVFTGVHGSRIFFARIIPVHRICG